MPRHARFLEPLLPYHVTQRGNYRQAVFADEEDRHKYMDTLHFYAGRYQLEIWGYCLMDNHVHLIVFPEREESLARGLGVTHMAYAQYLHRKTAGVARLPRSRDIFCRHGRQADRSRQQGLPGYSL